MIGVKTSHTADPHTTHTVRLDVVTSSLDPRVVAAHQPVTSLPGEPRSRPVAKKHNTKKKPVSDPLRKKRK